MTASMTTLPDDAARRDAMTIHDRSLLIEAGAGSGKTAVLAGRITMMLASGISPKSIAAVTFTELAASELLFRVREFVHELGEGRIPQELRIALSAGVSAEQRRHLASASAAFDEITCSTIHGFCQRLITPYPVEANIDPGATIMDRAQSEQVFDEIVDAWVRDRLSGDAGGLIAELVLEDPSKTVKLIRAVVDKLRQRRSLAAAPAAPWQPLVKEFRDEAVAFGEFIKHSIAAEEETAGVAARFGEMASALDFALKAPDAATLTRLLAAQPHTELCTQTGAFKAFKKKSKWTDAAKRAGLSKPDGERLNTLATEHYDACCEAWTAMLGSVASHVLEDLLAEVKPVVELFRAHKRAAAWLDFDDLIFASRDLLRDHDAVRQALARRYAHVLVDEFQDTDPLQTEIFWRLCGDAPADVSPANWQQFRIRPGALFLVGDPKQAIYRFRGADVAAYVQARDVFRAQDPASILSISTNFRSCAPILRYVNQRFEGALTSPRQPGFTALDPSRGDRGDKLCVAALDVMVPAAVESGKASAEQQRDAEAETVAKLCAHLIGNELLPDRKSREHRPCRPGDIALLAPTGIDLWRYEGALERLGIPVTTQAGKGLFRRQEIQDLIALTRVLANSRDRLALGALLRGPLVGLTEEELLDTIWMLPRSDDDPERLPRLDLNVDPNGIAHPLARDVLEKLQALRRRKNVTTPHELLSQAIDVLRVRPILLQRHPRQAERALSNVDLYLSLTRAYAVRGLRAFADAMTAAWSDEERAIEGRPDAQEEAVALYTMHAAKGLEWPIVVPVNTMTVIKEPESALTDRSSGHFYCPVLGVHPTGYDEARDAETAELNRERIRLWYVAATRARELLVIPRLNVSASRSAWVALLDLSLSSLPALDLGQLPVEGVAGAAPTVNSQSREVFAEEAERIAGMHHPLKWKAPSRDEGLDSPIVQTVTAEIISQGDEGQNTESAAPIAVQGGRERGLIIHKLLEEVLTGETLDGHAALKERAAALIQALGKPVVADPLTGLSSGEIADCVVRTLQLPQIAALRPTLLPEFPVYASQTIDGTEYATAGITDAMGFAPDGTAQIVIDWKSDVDPKPETVEHYRAQVASYLRTTGAASGLIVFVTTGTVVQVGSTG